MALTSIQSQNSYKHVRFVQIKVVLKKETQFKTVHGEGNGYRTLKSQEQKFEQVQRPGQ